MAKPLVSDETLRELVERGLTAAQIAHRTDYRNAECVRTRLRTLGLTAARAKPGRKANEPGRLKHAGGTGFLHERLQHERVTTGCAACGWEKYDVPALDAHDAFQAHPCSAGVAT